LWTLARPIAAGQHDYRLPTPQFGVVHNIIVAELGSDDGETDCAEPVQGFSGVLIAQVGEEFVGHGPWLL